MLRAVLSLRFVMLLGSLGSVVGAALMFWEGAVKLGGAMASAAGGSASGIFAYATALGASSDSWKSRAGDRWTE